MGAQARNHKHSSTHTCNTQLKQLPEHWHLFVMNYGYTFYSSCQCRTLLTFCEAFGEAWFLAVPYWESTKRKSIISHQCMCFTENLPDCFSAARHCPTFLCLSCFYANQWLSLFPVKTGRWAAEVTTRCWPCIKCSAEQSQHWKGKLQLWPQTGASLKKSVCISGWANDICC